MPLLEILIFSSAFVAIILLAAHQLVAQVREYGFYKRNGGDFSVDSGVDNLKLDACSYQCSRSHELAASLSISSVLHCAAYSVRRHDDFLFVLTGMIIARS